MRCRLGAVMALREHHGLVKTRDRIAFWRATLERLAAETGGARRPVAKAGRAGPRRGRLDHRARGHLRGAHAGRPPACATPSRPSRQRSKGASGRPTAKRPCSWTGASTVRKRNASTATPSMFQATTILSGEFIGQAADAAPGTMPPEFAAALAQYRAWTRARACLAAMASVLQARTRLVEGEDARRPGHRPRGLSRLEKRKRKTALPRPGPCRTAMTSMASFAGACRNPPVFSKRP